MLGLCAVSACSLALDLDDYEFVSSSAGSAGVPSGGAGAQSAGGAGNGGDGGGGNSDMGGSDMGGGGSAPSNPDAPVAVLDAYRFQRGMPYAVADNLGVLANDSGPGLVAVADGPIESERGGSVALRAAGGFDYTPPGEAFWGDDYFTYSVENADGQSSAHVRLSVQPDTVALADVLGGAGNGTAIAGASSEAPIGNSVAGAGDVNGDGLADVIIGAPNVDAASAGAAYVVFGRRIPAGQPTVPAVSLGTFPGDRGFVIGGALDAARLGSSVSGAGDVNGDGYADVIVGAPGSEPGVDGGAAYVIFGKPGAEAVSVAALVDGGNAGFRLDGGLVGDLAGWAVAGAGDVNGDGLADVIVAARFANQGFGEAYVVFGKTSGSPLSLGDLSASQGYRIIGDQEASEFRVSGAGDMNGDGLAEVAVATDSGVYVVRGARTAVELDLAAFLPQQGFVVRGADEFELAQSSASSAGDVNGDGYDDLVLSAPLRRSVAVVYGSPNRGDVSLDALPPGDGFVVGVGSMYEQNSVGFAVSGAGDMNGDGRSDLFVTGFNEGSGSFPANGFWIFGSPDAPSLDFTALQGGIRITGVEPNDLEDSSVSSAGDMNGDGLDDWVVGSGFSSSVNDGFILYGWDTSEALGQRDTALQNARGGSSLSFDGRPLVSATGSLQTDVLVFSGASLTLDLRELTPRLSNIEQIDLTGSGDNTLILSDAAVRRIPQSRSGVPAGLAKTLVVTGNSGDRVMFDLTGYSPLPSNAGRAVFGRDGAAYGLEVTSADMIVAPP